VKRQQLKVWTTLAVGVIRHQSLVLFTAAGRPPFTDSIDSVNDAARRAPVASGSMANSRRELRAVIHIAG
jgi:hypothetical protein